MAANHRETIRRSSSDLDLFKESQWAVMVPMKDYPDVLCRIDSFQRPLSTSNLCQRSLFGTVGYKDKLRIVESPNADESANHVADDAMFDQKMLRSFVAKICSKRTIVLLRGPSGSGKSTFAAVVARHSGPSSIVLTTDEFYVAIDGSYRFRGTLISTAHEWNRRRTRHYAKIGRSPILIDNTNLAPFEMAPYVQLADEFGYKVVIKEPPTSWKRDAEICAMMSRHQVPEKKTRMMVRKFQPIDVGKLRELMARNVATAGRNGNGSQRPQAPLLSQSWVPRQPAFGASRPPRSSAGFSVPQRPSVRPAWSPRESTGASVSQRPSVRASTGASVPQRPSVGVRSYASSTHVTATVQQMRPPQQVSPRVTTPPRGVGQWSYPPGFFPPGLPPPPGFPSMVYQQDFSYTEAAWGFTQPVQPATSNDFPQPNVDDLAKKVDEAVDLFSRVQCAEKDLWTTLTSSSECSNWNGNAWAEPAATETWTDASASYKQAREVGVVDDDWRGVKMDVHRAVPSPLAAGGPEIDEKAGYAEKRNVRSRQRHAE